MGNGVPVDDRSRLDGPGEEPARIAPFGEARRLALLEQLPEAILVIDDHGRILYLNQTAVELSGAGVEWDKETVLAIPSRHAGHC